MERPRQQPSIVFVDDDRQHLDAVAAMLRDHADHWRVEFLHDADEAVELLGRRQIDVIVTDLAMPTLDGVELLERVRDTQPQAVRIVLSGEGDEAELLRAIPFAHQWLSKPLEPEMLFAVIERALISGSFVHRDDLRSILGHAQALPSIPRLFAEVTKLIANTEVDVHAIANVVERDPAMAAKVLQMANCAYYRPERPLASIREAVMRIGLRTLANCVLAAELFQSMPREDRQTAQLIDASEERARTLSTLLTRWCDDGPEFGPEVRELLPTAGLLHEVGALVLVRFDPLSLRTVRRLAQRHRLAAETLERRLLGASHAQIAGSILGTWGLPWPLVDLLANHHDPDRSHAPHDLCTALSTAEMFVTAPWQLEEHERLATANGWAAQFAAWRAAAEEMLPH